MVSFAPLFLPLPLSHCPSPGPHFLLYIHAHLPLSKEHSLELPSVLLEDVVLEIWSSLSSCSSLFLFALFTVSSIVISITRVTQFSKIEVIFLFGNAVGNHFRHISLFNKLKAHLSFVKTYWVYTIIPAFFRWSSVGQLVLCLYTLDFWLALASRFVCSRDVPKLEI